MFMIFFLSLNYTYNSGSKVLATNFIITVISFSSYIGWFFSLTVHWVLGLWSKGYHIGKAKWKPLELPSTPSKEGISKQVSLPGLGRWYVDKQQKLVPSLDIYIKEEYFCQSSQQEFHWIINYGFCLSVLGKNKIH